jgi:diguanylate cyclase (GGDEF)-like protein
MVFTKRKFEFGTVVAFLLLILIGLVTYKSTNQFIEAAESVTHTQEVISEIERVESLLKDAETGERGYVITGKADYLEPYDAALKSMNQRVNHLKGLTQDNPSQQERIKFVEPLIQQRLDLLSETITLRGTKGFEAAQKAVATDKGKQVMDDLRRVFAEMRREERLLLQHRTEQSKSSTLKTSGLFVYLLVVMLGLFMTVYYLIKRDTAEHARLEYRLRLLATRDGLTRLLNRRELNRRLRVEAERFQRYHRPVSFLLFDLDHFKSINDRYGHQTGDEVLRWITRQVRENIRSVDIAARYGGEEIAVILPEVTSQEALRLAERLRKNISAQPFVTTQNDGKTIEISVTISIGLAEFSERINSDEAVVKAADNALYRAKHEGRNRVMVHTEAHTETGLETSLVD